MMRPEQMEKVLSYLPQPSYVDVYLFGDFDYSIITFQAQELVEDIELINFEGAVFRLKNPTKEKILNIYRKSYEYDNNRTPNKNSPKSIHLHNLEWSLSDVDIIVDPFCVKASCRGKEPEYLSKMREELAGTGVGIEVKITNR